MKTLKLLFVALFATLLLVSCEKDENGQRIKYYDKPTGEGYVFWENDDGSIIPISNCEVSITAVAYSGSGELFAIKYEHTDRTITNGNGKFTFDFVKSIRKGTTKIEKMSYYDFFIDINTIGIENNSSFNIGYVRYRAEYLNEFDLIVVLDTIFFKHKYTNEDF